MRKAMRSRQQLSKPAAQVTCGSPFGGAGLLLLRGPQPAVAGTGWVQRAVQPVSFAQLTHVFMQRMGTAGSKGCRSARLCDARFCSCIYQSTGLRSPSAARGRFAD